MRSDGRLFAPRRPVAALSGSDSRIHLCEPLQASESISIPRESALGMPGANDPGVRFRAAGIVQRANRLRAIEQFFRGLLSELLGVFADQRACRLAESLAYPASQSAAQRSGDRGSESGRGDTNSRRDDHVLLTVLGFSAIRGRSHGTRATTRWRDIKRSKMYGV
jgi:hypothetical protein